MLSHAGDRWRTECERCNAPIEIVGAADKRASKSGPELMRAAEFLKSLGWSPLHRKNAGYRVEWWCDGCARVVARSTKNAITASVVALPPDEIAKRQA